MRLKTSFLFLLASSFICSRSLADWTDPGSAYLCDKKNNVFSLVSVMETSDETSGGNVTAPPGYTRITSSSHLKCNLKPLKFEAEIQVDEPRATGTCAGFTHTFIREMKINGTSLFNEMKSFNSACFLDPEMYSIEVKGSNDKSHIKICYATWSWEKGYTVSSCNEKEL